MFKFLSVFLLSFSVQSIYGSASFITPCKYGDLACHIKSTQAAVPFFVKGLPEYGIPSHDPLYVQSGKFESTQLNIKYSDVNIYRIGEGKVVDLVRDKTNIKVVMELPLRILGKYDLKGKILFLDVLGNGDAEITTDNIRFKLDLKISTVKGADGKDHWKVNGFDYSYEYIKKVYIKLTNLFGGDEEKAKPIKEVLDTNWKELIEEIGDPIIKEMLTIIVANINKIFKVFPCEELEVV